MNDTEGLAPPVALVVAHDPIVRSKLVELLHDEEFDAREAGNLDAARQQLDATSPDVILLGFDLPDGAAIDLLDHPCTSTADVLAVDAHPRVDTAVEALRRGARDYLPAPMHTRRLRRRLRELFRHRKALGDVLVRCGMVGRSAAMRNVFRLIGKVAPTEATVLLTGESGTGKELAARAVHASSRRARGDLVSVNCGAVSPHLIASELFGHEKGAFTGADHRRKGYFERARKGTLFLDEITEMPLQLQVSLLRVLESRKISRVGSSDEIDVDVRLVAATNLDPEEAVRRGQFREDLYYRLKVFPIEIPPLRLRPDDVKALASRFLNELQEKYQQPCTLSEEALDLLRAHDWPGNVRELRNVIRAAHIMAEQEITPACLPALGARASSQGGQKAEVAAAAAGPGRGLSLTVGTSIREAEEELIIATMTAVDGNKREAARLLGISLKTLYNRLHRYSHRPEVQRWLPDREREAGAS